MVGIHTYALEMDTVATAKLAVGEGGGGGGRAQQGLLTYRADVPLRDNSLGLGTWFRLFAAFRQATGLGHQVTMYDTIYVPLHQT